MALLWHTYSSLHKKIRRCNIGRGTALQRQEKPVNIIRKQIYVCPKCGKGYTLKIKLLRHQKFESLWHKRTHGYDVGDTQYQHRESTIYQTRERTYVCADCGKSYAVKRSLWRHRKFECVNAKPRFSCDICSYKSPHKWCMDKHKKKHHNTNYNRFLN
ncbi:PREDICTED: zinc finger protein 629-like [Vollenhovia emeryi]|uniref:zinc finger protein 629-like n=1 Tax=Vollenhovia emeryi TaxID=411798 RepID=UPI0005F4B531|nr:PREDICTED: zinc finger protein 629-like [Vollenhovia emeryi]